MLAKTQDSEEIIERVAALDIGKAELVCCVRVPGEDRPGRWLQEVESYPAMTRSLLGLVGRLACLSVRRVVMEAASDCWKPVFYLLEAAGFETWLVNAKDVKHLPGRPKTGRLDCIWLCTVAGRQMIRPSFVPPPEFRGLRDLTRYRAGLVAARTAEKNRVEKLLEDTQIKLSVVVSDIFGISGRDMLAALVAGERNPKVLAQLARRAMRRKITVLEEAFTGYFTGRHAFLLGRMLARVDAITGDIADLDARIEEQIAPFAVTVAKCDEVPGINLAAAHAILAEIGLDMARFPPPGTWCPGQNTHPGEGISGQQERQELHRPRQLPPGPDPGQRRRGRRQDRHLPRRALPADRPPPRRQESQRRHRPLHPGHHLAPAGRSRHALSRPRLRLLRRPHRP
jgi:transposase